MKIVRYWWTHDWNEELCYLNKVISQGDVQCGHCKKVIVVGNNVFELTPLRKITYYFDEHVQPDKYIECSSCIGKRIEEVSRYAGVSYEELLYLLKTIEIVEELNTWRYEIGRGFLRFLRCSVITSRILFISMIYGNTVYIR